MEWRPIESAPQDGTRILGWDGMTVSVTYYRKGGAWPWRCEAEATDDGYGASFHDVWGPTHWMPLPEPPSTPDAPHT